MSIELVFLIIYFVAMGAIGVWSVKKGSGDSEGFLLGGRSLGPAVTALRLQSSSMSGYMFMGAGSLGNTQGYFGMWYAMGDIGGGVLNLSILGRRMRKLSQMLGSLTSIEYLEHRYPSKWTRAIAAPIAVFCIFFYVMSQFIGGGRGLEMVTGIPYEWALLIAVGVIVFYTFLGGYLAVAYTDFVQAIIMLIGMLWIFIATMMAVGGLTAGNEKVAEINPNLLSMFGPDGYQGDEWGIIIGAVLVFSIGYLGWPHVVVSHMAMKKPSVARSASMYATGFNLLFIPAPYIIGLMALLVVPGLTNPEMAIFEVADTVLPPFAVGIVMAAIMAAIMSTADALLLQSGTIASQDLYRRFFNRNMSEKQSVWVSRFTVLGLSIIGYVVAVNDPPAVAAIVIFSTTVLGAAFVPAYICAVWWKKANTPGALASMITGTVVAVGWEVLGLADLTTIDPMGSGIVSSTLAMIIVSLATQKSHPVPAHIREAVVETAKVGPIPARLAVTQNSGLAAQVPVSGAEAADRER
ncbi:sodium/proline symporter [Brevibacterium salitolerans]|uniref:Sodium/proline symporter n=1 Tax=Brevibacterium salitolerans TaxID=1403566 RepID=A0ABN2W962_9MICO